MAIVKIHGQIRELLTANQTFVMEKEAEGALELYRMSRRNHKLPSLLNWREDIDAPGSLVLEHQRFIIEAIDMFLFTKDPEAYASTTMRIRVGERDQFSSAVLGAPNGASYFRHFEFQHMAKGECACIEVNPLQWFIIEFNKLPAAKATIQVALYGHVFNPVP